jgi:hypothetical protein
LLAALHKGYLETQGVQKKERQLPSKDCLENTASNLSEQCHDTSAVYLAVLYQKDATTPCLLFEGEG